MSGERNLAQQTDPREAARPCPDCARHLLGCCPHDLEMARKLLSKAGFKVGEADSGGEADDRFYLNGKELSWSTREKDLLGLNGLIALIQATASLLDEDFRQRIIPVIEQAARHISLLQRLNDENIQRSPVHELPPFGHILEVLKCLRTDGYCEDDVLILRAGALLHDLGKLCIADNDILQLHALITAILVEQLGDFLVRQARADDELQNSMTFRQRVELLQNPNFLWLLSNHHLMEMLERKQVEFGPLKKQVEPKWIVLLAQLTLADVESVGPYVPYGINSIVFLTVMARKLEPEFAEYWAVIRDLLVTSLPHLVKVMTTSHIAQRANVDELLIALPKSTLVQPQEAGQNIGAIDLIALDGLGPEDKPNPEHGRLGFIFPPLLHLLQVLSEIEETNFDKLKPAIVLLTKYVDS